MTKSAEGSPSEKRGFLDLLIKVAPLLIAAFAFIGLIFTIQNTIDNKKPTDNEPADTALAPAALISTLADEEAVDDVGGIVKGDFEEGGCGTGFISKKDGEFIAFPPIGDLANMKAGTVEMCVTLKKKLEITGHYFLFMVHDTVGSDRHSIILEIDWNENKVCYNVRLRIKPGRRALSRKLDWEKGDHHHIAATWGAEGVYLYIDGEINMTDRYINEAKKPIRLGRQKLNEPFAINNIHHERVLAIAPTYCVIRNLEVCNYQKSGSKIKENYEALHPSE